MLSYLVQHISEYLSSHGTVIDVILRSDQSLVEEEEMREVLLSFAVSEEEGHPVATIHLVELADERCEVEVEVEFPVDHADSEAGSRLWKRAKEIVSEISFTEKCRYLEPEQPPQTGWMLDYHFILEQPGNAEEEQRLADTLRRFSADLGKLVRLD